MTGQDVATLATPLTVQPGRVKSCHTVDVTISYSVQPWSRLTRRRDEPELQPHWLASYECYV